MYKFFLPGSEVVVETKASDKSIELSEKSRERIYTKIAQQSRYVPISDWTLLGLVFRGIVTYTDLRLGRINYRDVLYLNDALKIRNDIEAFELASAQAESEARKLQ